MTTPADTPDSPPWAPPGPRPPAGPEAPRAEVPDSEVPGSEATPAGESRAEAAPAVTAHGAGVPQGPEAAVGSGMPPGPAMAYPAQAQAPAPFPGSPYGPGVPQGPGVPGVGPYGVPAARTGLGVGALVIGVVGLLFGIVPFLFWLGGFMGVLALVLGIVGYGRANRGEATDRGQAVAGIVLGAVTIVVAAAWLVVLIVAAQAVERIDERVREKEGASAEPFAPDGTARPEPSPEPTETETTPSTLAFGRTHTYEDGVKVTVSVPKPYRPDGFAAGYEKGDTALRVTITIVNGSDEALDVTTALPDARDAEGARASTIFDGSRATEMFRGTVLPGKQVKAGYAFALPADADGELQIELAPKLLAYEPVIWTGPVK
ncbi:DUF4190 domain-containing protein [Streptomyces sp. NPDC056361]|uniref:DUF4190 domain-containing protein n=1 Tax=Streptomyces sp. NPDC056361 TaxID=3345795 RepID=UPI0035E18917